MISVLVFSLFAAAAPSAGECGFYRESARRLQCPADNYLLRFGDRYCRAFEAKAGDFSAEGRVFLRKIRPCLIRALDRENLGCGDVQAIALESHVGCYARNGFCGLPFLDKARIAFIVREEVRRPDFRSVMNRIQSVCDSL